MDEFFEQMLSASSWGYGVSSMAVDSVGALQSLSKMGSTHMIPSSGDLAGDLESQGPPHSASQEHQDDLFDSHQAHLQLNKTALTARGLSRGSPAAVEKSSEFQQPSQSRTLMAATWREPYMGSMPPLPSNMGQGKPNSFPLSGEGMLNDLHLGKRTRDDEDTMKASLIHGAQPRGDQALSCQTTAGAAMNGTTRAHVRARRGQATDPHSIAERKRRERIAERMKALQELVPDSNKTDKASMLDEIIGYVKFLQMQVKCLSMCRLGCVSAAAPLLADLPAEGAANFIAANLAQANGISGPSQDGIAFAERQVAQLMDEDMSAAMQYLQSKGLCLMPISLATAISSTGARQQSMPATGSDAGGNEQQAMELQVIAARCGTNPGEMAALPSNGISANDDLAKSGGNMPKLSNEMLEDENGNEKVGHGLLSTSSEGGPRCKEDAQR